MCVLEETNHFIFGPQHNSCESKMNIFSLSNSALWTNRREKRNQIQRVVFVLPIRGTFPLLGQRCSTYTALQGITGWLTGKMLYLLFLFSKTELLTRAGKMLCFSFFFFRKKPNLNCHWTQVYLGSDLWVQVSLTPWPFWDLTDVTLANEDTNSILTDSVNRAIQGNVTMQII